MMNRTIVACIFTYCCAAQAQTPAQFDANAKLVAARSPLVHQSIHPLKGGAQWGRYQVSVSNFKWDVKKTDSLLAPMIAVVSADLSFTSTSPQDTREQAEVAEMRPPKDIDRVEMTYTPTDNGWQWASGRTNLAVLNKWNPIAPGDGNLPKDMQMRWLAEAFTLPIK
jgi:hypothetical protein